jgi:proline racemase
LFLFCAQVQAGGESAVSVQLDAAGRAVKRSAEQLVAATQQQHQQMQMQLQLQQAEAPEDVKLAFVQTMRQELEFVSLFFSPPCLCLLTNCI